MKPIRTVLIALACAMPVVVFAQWMWVDNGGRKVLSDQPPPMDIPAKNILKQPGARAAPAPDAAASAAAALSAKPELSAAKAPGKDKELEAKRKAAETAEAEKAKAKDEEIDKVRADNCGRAKQAKSQLDSGIRLGRMNAKGEREVMDDAARAVEMKRIDGIMTRDCGPRQG